MNLTEYIASFAAEFKSDRMTNKEMVALKRAILDTLGVGLAGSLEPACNIIADLISEVGPRPITSVIGRTLKCEPSQAALLDGVACHVLDYDDVQLSTSPDRVFGLLMHPSSPVLSALMPLGEKLHSSGRSILESFYVGTEVACRIADAMNHRAYSEGFHTSGTVGALGAAAACASLSGLDNKQIKVALGIAASLASGIRRNFGTMTKSLHVGRAAETGILAVSLAEKGFTAAPDVLEAKQGFLQATAGGFAEDKINSRLGAPSFYLDPGVAIKPHPSATLTHPAMTAMMTLVLENDLKPSDVESIEVGTNSYVPTALMYDRPANALQAKFSMQYCIAVLLTKRRAGLAEFTDSAVADIEVAKATAKVKLTVHKDAEAAGYNKILTILAVRLTNGRILTRKEEFALGHPLNPMSDLQLKDKFLDCAKQVIPKDNAELVVSQVSRLDELHDIRELSSLLTPKEKV